MWARVFTQPLNPSARARHPAPKGASVPGVEASVSVQGGARFGMADNLPVPIDVQRLSGPGSESVVIRGGFLPEGKPWLPPRFAIINNDVFIPVGPNEYKMGVLLCGKVNMLGARGAPGGRILSRIRMLTRLPEERNKAAQDFLTAALEAEAAHQQEEQDENAAKVQKALQKCYKGARGAKPPGLRNKKMALSRTAAWNLVPEVFEVSVPRANPAWPSARFSVLKGDARSKAWVRVTGDHSALELLMDEAVYVFNRPPEAQTPPRRTRGGSPGSPGGSPGTLTPTAKPKKRVLQSSCYFVKARKAWVVRIHVQGQNKYRTFPVGEGVNYEAAFKQAQRWKTAHDEPLPEGRRKTSAMKQRKTRRPRAHVPDSASPSPPTSPASSPKRGNSWLHGSITTTPRRKHRKSSTTSSRAGLEDRK